MNVGCWSQDAPAVPAATPVTASGAQAAAGAAAPPVAKPAPAAEPATSAEPATGAATAPADFLPQASTFAPSIDDAFVLILWFAVFLALVVAGTFALLAWRGAKDAGEDFALPRSSGLWAAVAALLLAAVFFVQGARVRADMEVAPRGALLIRVSLAEAGFLFTYPNGFATGELHLPQDRAVRFAFQGAAEPYTFAVPAFRLSVAVPLGTQREAWAEPSLAGEYEVRSRATTLDPERTRVAQALVHAPGGYEKWYQDISGPPLDLPPLELGQRSYQMRGCTQCHSIDGTKVIGPTFQGFLAREHRMQDGTVVEPTDAYIQESLLEPQAKVVEGFEPVMPSFRGRLHELEIAGLAAYIKSLQ